MRRVFAWITGAVGGIAAYRLLHRRHDSPQPSLPPEPDPRAEELRAKLEQHAEPVAERSAEADEIGGPEDPDAERRRVHESARATIEQMRRPPG